MSANEFLSGKRAFLASLQREEQLGTLFDWSQSNRDEVSKVLKRVIDLEAETVRLNKELSGIGRRKINDDTMSTTDKFKAQLNISNATWFLWRDRVFLPAISNSFSIILVTILALSFGQKFLDILGR